MTHLFKVIASVAAVGSLIGMGMGRVVAQTIDTGSVISVEDGNILRIRTHEKTLTVRLACIDAPDTDQSAVSLREVNRLKQLLPAGQPISFRVTDTDRYSRTIAKVYRGDLSINLTLVREGGAVVYRDELFTGCPELSDRLLSAEAEAKSQQRGLWKSKTSMIEAKEQKSISNQMPSVTPQTSSSPFMTKVDWSRAEQDILDGKYTTGVTYSPFSAYDGSYSGAASSSGACDSPGQTDSLGRRCGGRAASERPGGR